MRSIRWRNAATWVSVASGLALLLSTIPARGQDSGRLLATSGVSQIEGPAGGGLVPWALIAGYGTRDAIGATAHDTFVHLSDFNLNTAGASVGLFDRLELSYVHDWFATGDAGVRLGLGQGFQFHMDVAGVKLRLLGNAVYDQDRWLPQIAVGALFKAADQRDLVKALGARSADGADFYLAATKIFLAQSLLVNATLIGTEANQFGLLGFGGDRHAGYTLQFGGSAALLLTRRFAVGAEFRTKPDNLSFASEGPAFDAFAAYFFNKHVSATLAYVDLGPIARQGVQNGAYLSLQVGF